MRKPIPFVAFAFVLATAGSAFAAGVVSYQGRVDVGGSAYSGTAYVKFAVVNQAGNTSYWSNDGTSSGGGQPTAAVQVSVSGGLFEVMLGDTTIPNMTVAFTGAEFGGGDRFLRVWLSTNGVTFTQMAPDKRIASSPTVLQAVLGGDGSSITNIDASQITLGTLNDARLSSNVALLNRTPQIFSGQNRFLGDNTITVPLKVTSNALDSTCMTAAGTTVFQVDRSSGIYAKGVLGCGTIPLTGSGEKLYWHPYKAAFRAGSIGSAGTQWDDPNVGFYTWAGGYNTIALGLSSFAMGYQTQATGSYSTAFGYTDIADGTGSAAIGYRSHACGDYSVVLGQRASDAGGDSTGTGTGPASDCSTNTSQHVGVFMFSDASTTSAFFAAATNEFAARASGGFRFRTNSTLTTGCNLPAGSGVFSCASTRKVKENFEPVDGEAVLGKLANVPVVRWNYIDDQKKSAHLGPMAEDFHDAFSLGENDVTIGVQDLSGVALVAAQALEKRTRELSTENERLAKENEALRARLARIEERLGLGAE